MNTIIIYDSTGYIISQMSGEIREPIGIPFIWIEIPEGKQLKIINGIGVDTNVTPNIATLEDIPMTETEVLQNDQLDQTTRLNQIEADSYAFQEYILSQLPPQ